MCGIAGWIGSGKDPHILQAMMDMIRHRGPDGGDQAFFQLGNGMQAALGHRRLSIVDIGGGAQPMLSHDGRFAIVYNGEIYNHVELRKELEERGSIFRTDHSDTEVVLEAWRSWGPACLARFRGMFAFALFDNREKSVVLARDPFGKKPVFISRLVKSTGEEIVFASEIQALLKHPEVKRDLDLASLYDYLCWRYVPGPNTFFQSIKKLGPGSYLTWKSGTVVEKRYWTPPEELRDRPAAPENAIEDFLSVFDEFVHLRLRADVPVGAFLSSGLDSTSIIATLAHLGVSQIRTYSIGFRGDRNSEVGAANETARFYGTLHTPVEVDSNHLVDDLPALSRHRGAPVSEAADLPIYMMSKEAAKSVKVVLSGEGSDELFGGYPKHLAETHLGWLAPSGALSAIGRVTLAAASISSQKASKLALAARAMSEDDFERRMVRWFGSLSHKEREDIWRGKSPTRITSRIPFQAAETASPLRRVLHYDQTSWLPDNLLERMDTMTMAASIEARAPFMDVRLAEFAATLPDHWRIKGRVTKRIVREALGPRLPPAVLTRKKIGFRMPVAAWFRGPLKEPFRDLVLGSGAISSRYLDSAVMSRIFEEHLSGKSNHEKTLWSFYTLELFLREFF